MFNELDLKLLWKDLDDYALELDKETKSLQEVWLKIAEVKAQQENEIKELMSRSEFNFLPSETIIAINVGGQLFETPVEVLTSDPYSILAACCRVETPIKPGDDGIFFFDRDWWIFRHIVSFLRSNKLPNEMETLKELYKEASFYRLEKLQRAIESIPVDQVTNFSPQITVIAQGMSSEVAINGAPQVVGKDGKEERIYEKTLFRYY